MKMKHTAKFLINALHQAGLSSIILSVALKPITWQIDSPAFAR